MEDGQGATSFFSVSTASTAVMGLIETTRGLLPGAGNFT